MTNASSLRSRLREALPYLFVAASVAVVALAGSGGAEAHSGRIAKAFTARTLVSTPHRIWAFAQDGHGLTWVSRSRNGTGCGMYVLTRRGGKPSIARLPARVCAQGLGGAQLGSGTVAWIKVFNDGHGAYGELQYDVWAITAGASAAAGSRPQLIEQDVLPCALPCDSSQLHPAIAGSGALLVYTTGTGAFPDVSFDEVKRIVSGHARPLLDTKGADIDALAVGGGAVEAVTRHLVVGDGCGCLGAPVWSPDGTKIGYLDGEFFNQSIAAFPPAAAVAVMNADGSGRHDLTPVNDAHNLSWSPDGKQIAYDTSNSGTIVVVNTDGSGSLQLGSAGGGRYDPSWSPDGSKIAFAYGGFGTLDTMNPDGSNVQVLAAFPEHLISDNGIAWSPDGSRIAFSLDGMLELVNADGSNPHPLGPAGDEPSWSPDGKQIVFHTRSGLSIIGADGSGLHQLTGGPDEHPSWSPDGKTIVFASERDDPYANAGELHDQTYPELYLVNTDGSNLRPLSFTKPSVLEHQASFYSATGRPLPSLPGLPALIGNIAAVGTVAAGVDQITLLDATTGRQLARVTVGKARGNFSVAGGDTHWVVFHRGRTISALNLTSHHVRRLTTAAANPLDLSVARRRVAWAENRHIHGRIRAVELPS